MLRSSFLFFLMLTLGAGKMYHRDFYPDGEIKEEGWKERNSKEGFWKFYYPNGQIESQGHFKKNLRNGYWYFRDENGKPKMEGHFKAGEKAMWWLFYDENGKINHKCQLKNGIKNGYCLKYTDEELKSAEKYKNGKKIKEWFSFGSFKKENKLSDLK
ncbi:toxin-antitoxin system YwqK family antitoxin [Flagellimonas myxillae]|uniref:toxin-antitoxin system YwqK family antitoxin n=1 Tax=Flagellimonas myxillae TaxID=2942214 RepID=UPI00201F350A|nr:hypothetical protein [Muricauda myxillae]MCL6267628.1 hypothetical protein [Muricauda myxillae]